jgi:acetyl-CoA C-acetyltransferase
MLALILATQQILLGDASCILVLGLESMSNAPHMVRGARWGLRLQHGEFVDTLKECTLAGSRMWGDPCDMIGVAEQHATVDGIARESMDEYAFVSHHRAIDALDEGRFDREIVPVDAASCGGVGTMGSDEHPRRDISLERLRELPPIRVGGTITAGNAAGINDGAAAALICSDDLLSRLGLSPLARVVDRGWAMAACDPNLMGYSAVHAASTALSKAELEVDDMDLIECNEGFAVQLLACERMGSWPRERLNVDGGSIGLGHPVGMSGLRITLHLGHALRLRDLRLGVATVPAGSGLGAAVVMERVA